MIYNGNFFTYQHKKGANTSNKTGVSTKFNAPVKKLLNKGYPSPNRLVCQRISGALTCDPFEFIKNVTGSRTSIRIHSLL